MRTITMTAQIGEDRELTVQLPPDIVPGKHQIVVVIEEEVLPSPLNDTGDEADDNRLWAGLPVMHTGPWINDISLRREDMYDEWGR